MRKTEWFRKIMDYLEQYKTDRNKYKFTDEFMFHITVRPSSPSIAYCLYISKEVLPKLK